MNFWETHFPNPYALCIIVTDGRHTTATQKCSELRDFDFIFKNLCCAAYSLILKQCITFETLLESEAIIILKKNGVYEEIFIN